MWREVISTYFLEEWTSRNPKRNVSKPPDKENTRI